MTRGTAAGAARGDATESRGRDIGQQRTGLGTARAAGQVRPSAGQPAQRPQPGRGPGLWGTRPGRLGVFAVIGAALLGMLTTVLAGAEPGFLLSLFVIAGSVAAALAVRPSAVYSIFPVPAPAYTAAAVIAGLIHDHAADASRAALALSAAQWIANGFIAMTLATGLAIAIGWYRWWRSPRPQPGRLATGRGGPAGRTGTGRP